jgi:hypothetical protein
LAPRPNKIFGDYEILETIARGGMGVVYKACHIKLNRVVALKMILSGQFANSDDIDRFHAEAEAAARLSHPNIVGIHDSGQSDGQHYISMQFVEGQSLADLVREHPLHPRAAAKYMASISEAMQYAHDHGILHRDLKPANILVDTKGVPLVTDFGLAKLNPSDALGDTQGRAGHSQMTMDGTVMGTASYMPPEQAIGNLEEISERSDVYSLGATLYDLLTGKPPFGAANVHETIRQVIEAEPVAPRVLNANVPKDLETICLKCLQKAPARRYTSAGELAEELQRYRAGEPILARPVGFVEHTFRWCYRNPWPTTAICASLCGLIVAIILWQTAVHATDVATKAEAFAETKREEAEAARILAREAEAFAQTKREEAEASRRHLLAAINELFNTWGNVTILNEPALADVRRQLLAAATKLYKDMSKHLGDDPELQQEMGVSYFRLGDMMFKMKGYQEAAAAVHSALEIQQLDDLETVTDQERLSNLGATLTLRGNIMVEIGIGLKRSSEGMDPLTDAVQAYEDAIRVRTRLVKLVPAEIEHARQLLNSRMNNCDVEHVRGDRSFTRGGELNSQFVKLMDKKKVDEANRIRQLAGKQFEQAKEHYLEAQTRLDTLQEDRNQLLARAPDASRVRLDLIRDLAKGSFNLANITIVLREFDLSAQYVAAAIDDFERVLADKANDLEDQFDLAKCKELAGFILIERIRDLPELEPDEPGYEENLALKLLHHGRAFQHLTDATHIYRNLNSSSPSIVTKYRVALGRVLPKIGDLHFLLLKDDDARGYFTEAIKVLQPLADAHPESPMVGDLLIQAIGGLELLDSFQDVDPENETPAESTERDDAAAPEEPKAN